MGLFADSADLGGQFYRSFDQSTGGEDLANYFGEFKVAKGFKLLNGVEIAGVCAGCCYSWIKHYMNRPVILYTNEIMKAAKAEIMTVQLWVRENGVSLATLLGQSGMVGNGVQRLVTDEWSAVSAANKIKNTAGLYTLSYGGHVVVCFVDALARKCYFMDVHKGDVWLPQGSCGVWILDYLNLMRKHHGAITIRGFTAAWHAVAANRKFGEMQTDLDGESSLAEIDEDWKLLKGSRRSRRKSISESPPDLSKQKGRVRSGSFS